jgi:phosphate transport system substrate-binding protein
MVLAACTPTETTTPVESATAEETTAPTTGTASATEEITLYAGYDIATLTGTINAAGSSTVYPLEEAIAQDFTDEGFAGQVNINSVGTGGGFEAFCVNGETDISNASRTIKDAETASCATINRTPVAFRVGTDAIAVVVSSSNDFATDITMEELALLFTTATNWSDVRPEWPNEPIQRFSPGTDSGTFDYFVENVITKPQGLDVDASEALILGASNIQFSEDDNVLVQGVESSPYAIGYFGFAYYINQASNLKALSLNGIVPDAATAESGEYPMARPLYIYSDANIIREKPEVAAFIDYFLTNVNSVIGEVGYFPASDEALNEARQTLADILAQ